jgi:hypothetical protein
MWLVDLNDEFVDVKNWMSNITDRYWHVGVGWSSFGVNALDMDQDMDTQLGLR